MKKDVALLAARTSAVNERLREVARRIAYLRPNEEVKARFAAMSAAMRVHANAVEAISEHFEAMLKDERLQADPVTHAQIAEIFRQIMDLHVGEPFTSITATSAFKVRAKRGGLGKRAASEIQRRASIKYYLDNRTSFKN